MGVFIAASVSWNSSQLTEYKPYDANVIVVDRDDSDLSRALTKHLGSRLSWSRASADDTYDLADALSKSNSAKGAPTACSLSRRSLRTTSLRLPARGGPAQARRDLRFRHHGGGAFVCRGLALDLARGRCGGA